MGVVRLLCITIAFAFLATVAAQDCSGFGAIFNGRCVCLSGNAGANCENANAGACATAVHQPEQLKDNWFPDLVQSQDPAVTVNDPLIIAFTNNYLTLNINGELVQGRNYTDLFFINDLNPSTPVTDSRCSINGGATSFWTQSNQVADMTQTVGGATKYVYRCGDLFSLAMPWDQHQYCGFAANPAYEFANSTYHQYEAIVKLTYDDSFMLFDPQNPNDQENVHTMIKRHASVSYTIHVQFTKIVLVQVENVVVYSNVTLTVVLTQFEYNPADSSATMTFASIVRWPHILVRNFTTIEIPSRPELSFKADSGIAVGPYTVQPETDQNIRVNPDTDICSETSPTTSGGPNCLERFTTKVYLGAGSCNFDGLYTFGGLVSTCRDNDNYRICPSEMQFVALKLTNSGVCGAVTANPQVTGELVAFADSEHRIVQTDFLVGSRAYIAVKVNTRNSFHLKWLDIWTISVDDINMNDINDRIPAVTNLTYARPAHAQYFVQNARLQYGNFFTSSHPAGDATFDQATFPNGPIDLQGWATPENPLNGTITDGALTYGPSFNFRWDGGIFTPGVGQKKVYNIIARAQLTFEGNEHENRKREVKIVDFVYKPETSGMTASIMCGLSESNEVAPAAANEAVTSSSINMVAVKAAVPVAGVALVVVAVAVIAAVVIVRRKKSTAGFRTLN